MFCRIAGYERSIKKYNSDKFEVVFVDRFQKSVNEIGKVMSRVQQDPNSSSPSLLPEFTEFFKIRHNKISTDFLDLNDFSSISASVSSSQQVPAANPSSHQASAADSRGQQAAPADLSDQKVNRSFFSVGKLHLLSLIRK
jgi:hypothetical protein